MQQCYTISTSDWVVIQIGCCRIMNQVISLFVRSQHWLCCLSSILDRSLFQAYLNMSGIEPRIFNMWTTGSVPEEMVHGKFCTVISKGSQTWIFAHLLLITPMTFCSKVQMLSVQRGYKIIVVLYPPLMVICRYSYVFPTFIPCCLHWENLDTWN